MAEEQLGRKLTMDESLELENEYELFNNEDMDNQYTWSIGFIDHNPHLKEKRERHGYEQVLVTKEDCCFVLWQKSDKVTKVITPEVSENE
jgi:hypothetical protein